MPSCTRCPTSMARHFNAPVRGVFVANPGYVLGVGRRAARARRSPVSPASRLPTLPDFDQGGRGAARRRHARAALHDARRSEGHANRASMRMDRRWFPARQCKRDDDDRLLAVHRPCRQRRRPSRCAGPHDSFAITAIAIADALAPLAGAGEFRYAVLGGRHHRAQLSRHRPDRGRSARTGASSTATRFRSPLGDVRLTLRRIDRGARPRRVRASAAQPRGRLLRPEAARTARRSRAADASTRASCVPGEP